MHIKAGSPKKGGLELLNGYCIGVASPPVLAKVAAGLRGGGRYRYCGKSGAKAYNSAGSISCVPCKIRALKASGEKAERATSAVNRALAKILALAKGAFWSKDRRQARLKKRQNMLNRLDSVVAMLDR